MRKHWKIITSVLSTIVVIDLLSVAGWLSLIQTWSPIAYTQTPDSTNQVEVRLIDDDNDGIPDRGVVDLLARPATKPAPATQPRQVEVQLLDDNKDGIPDRGILELPARGLFNPDWPGQGLQLQRERSFRPPFAPLWIVGGLIRGLIGLAVLALLVSLTVFIYRRRRPTPALASVQISPAPSVAPLTPTEAGEPIQND
jgi:hypothetical protein